MLPLFLSIAGLAVDGGIVFGARRELQAVADSAARAGAMQVDPGAYRDSSGAAVVLDREAARRAAAEYLASQGAGSAAQVRVEPRRVVVEVRREVPTGFLRVVGYRSVQVTAVAPAEVRAGVERASS
jgi:Flp pilus assembly protein TadG